MVRAGNRTAVAGAFFSPETPVSGRSLTLGADAATHARVLRLEPGSNLRLSDGRGSMAHATLIRTGRDTVHVDVTEVIFVDAQPELHILVPVADKDRMLWLAEKLVETGITSWRPVQWRRSRSVATRGRGPAFAKRLHARMTSALEQSGGAWLPDIFPESTLERAIAAAPRGTRMVLDANAVDLFPAALTAPVVLVVGPEGGAEEPELDMFRAAAFTFARIAANTMRFETAGLAAAVLARAALAR